MSANATSRDLYLKISEATCISRAGFSLSTTCGQTLLDKLTNISDLTIEDGSRLAMNNTPRKETSVLTQVHKCVRPHVFEMLKSEVSDFFAGQRAISVQVPIYPVTHKVGFATMFFRLAKP